MPEPAATLVHLRRVAHEVPWKAALCAPPSSRWLVCRPEWGGMNYVVNDTVELEESGDTEQVLLAMIACPDERAAAEGATPETHRVFVNFAAGISRAYL